MSIFKDYLEAVSGDNADEIRQEIIDAYKAAGESSHVTDYKESRGQSVIFYTRYLQNGGGYRSTVSSNQLKKDKDYYYSIKITKTQNGLYDVRGSGADYVAKIEYPNRIQSAGKKHYETAEEAVSVMLNYLNKKAKLKNQTMR